MHRPPLPKCRLDASSRPEPEAGAAAAAAAGSCTPPQPPGALEPPLSEQQLATVLGRLRALALEADHLEATAAPPLQSYRDLWVCGSGAACAPAAGPAQQQQQQQGQQQQGRLPLVKCRRCGRVLLPPAAAAHAAQCLGAGGRPPSRAAAAAAAAATASQQRAASSLSEDEDELARSGSRGTSRGTRGAGGGKRKRPAAGAAGGGAGAKSKLSKGSGGRAVTPVVAAATARPAAVAGEHSSGLSGEGGWALGAGRRCWLALSLQSVWAGPSSAHDERCPRLPLLHGRLLSLHTPLPEAQAELRHSRLYPKVAAHPGLQANAGSPCPPLLPPLLLQTRS